MSDNKSIIDLDKSGKNKPLYEQIRLRLRDTISSEGMTEGDRLPSIYSLSKKWNVNYRTMRSAFEMLDKDGIISYRPNKGATVIKAQPEKQLTFSYVRWQRDSFCVNLSSGIRRFCEENDISLRMLDAAKSEKILIDAILHPNDGIDGVLLVPEHNPAYCEALQQAIDNDVKVVLLDRPVPGVESSTVCPDHFSGAYEAVSHLIREHDRPAYYVGRCEQPHSCKLWTEGWEEAMRCFNYFDFDKYKFDISPIEEGINEAECEDGCYVTEGARSFFEANKEEKYSIFAGNNYIARGIYTIAERLGLKIGEDIFVVGAGDSPHPDSFEVPLSCIWQNTEEVGYEGARVLHELVCAEEKRDVHVLLPTQMRVRQSSRRKI